MNFIKSLIQIKRSQLLLLLLIFFVNITFAQIQTEISVDFRVGNSIIESGYSNNSEQLSKIISSLQHIEKESTVELKCISFNGAVTPEGSFELNRNLAHDRLTSLENYTREYIDIRRDITITRDDKYIHWDYLISLVENSDIAHKEEVVTLLKGESKLTEYPDERREDSRTVALKALNNGKVWQTINNRFFSKMRNATVIIIALKKELPRTEDTSSPIHIVEEKEERVVVVDNTLYNADIPEAKEWTQQLYLKTNAVGWGMLIANVAVELDLSPHWSVALPVNYSSWDYFSHTLKFRTFNVQPEIRYWLREDDGFFVGAHLGLAYYNLAWDSDYRIQDKNRKTPALGGGVSFGYRIPISKNNRWKMEFSLGGGVYDLHYDKFLNVYNGFLAESVKKTFFGIDQVAVSFSYMFDLKKKRR
ncbi:MAG: DUF3575 domain-containing protein [Candidatus Saccharimonadaceae bacterium]